MTTNEALNFLELPDDADDQKIAERYKEKYNFFKTLYTNAPNNVVRNVQQRNLEKLVEVRSVLNIDGNTSGKNNPPSRGTTRAPSFHADAMPGKETPNQTDEPVAWLVVHTEDKPIVSYGVMEGENAVGRNEVPNRNNIILEEDMFVSRYHCVFIVAPARGQLAAAVADDGRFNKGKPSVNGTFLNGSEARISMTRIKDNDTIQIGMTKLVFKWNTSSKKYIEDQVGQSDYVKTVVVDI